MSIKINTKRGEKRKTRQQRQEVNSNRRLYWSTLVGQQSLKLGLTYYDALADKMQEKIKRKTRLINIYNNKIGLGTYYKENLEYI